MSVDRLEDLDTFLFLANPTETLNNPAPIPASTLTSIEEPEGIATPADSLASSSNINHIAADESLVVLDDDKGSFFF